VDRRSLLVPGLVLTALLAGCGPGGDSEAPTPDQAHLTELPAQDPYFDNLADSAILDLAERMCSEMDAGKPLDEINGPAARDTVRCGSAPTPTRWCPGACWSRRG